MQPAEILIELRRVLSPADAPGVLAALTEDKLVWESLQQPEFLHSILAEDSTLPSSWSPASLALRPLGNRVNFADLTAEHLPGIEVSLRKQALETPTRHRSLAAQAGFGDPGEYPAKWSAGRQRVSGRNAGIGSA